MHELELFRSIRSIWLQRAVQTLAHGTGLREDIRNQMERFFGLLEHSIETGDPAWLDTALQDWATSQTQTDLEGEPTNVTQIINQLMSLTYHLCREMFDTEKAVNLLDHIIFIFGYAFEKIAELEIRTKLAYATAQIAQVEQTIERLELSKSAFLSIAAHELRTPLTLIEGYATILSDNLEKSDPKSNNLPLLKGVMNGTQRLHNVVNDMLDASLIVNNLLTINFQPVWLNQIFSALHTELSNTLKDRRQQYTFLPFPGSDELTFADPDRLMQAFRNVLLNAIKFTPDGGKINVEGRQLSGFLEVTISDTGIGIDPEDQATIFDRFGRLGNIMQHSTGKTKFKGGGPGLGLSIAKGILDAHGGTIWVESPGFDEKTYPGSIFHVLIPFRSEPPDEKSAKRFASLITKE